MTLTLTLRLLYPTSQQAHSSSTPGHQAAATRLLPGRQRSKTQLRAGEKQCLVNT